MTDTTRHDGPRSWGWVRPVGWAGALALLLLPLVAMQFGDSGVNWTLSDFLPAAFLIGGAGLALELAVRTSPNRSYRAGAALGLLAGFLIIWANGAVGFIGSEDNPINLMYFAIPAIALVGSALSLFRAGGMAVAMAAAAVAQLAAFAVALDHGFFTGPLTVFFTGLWLASAWLFRKAARE